MAPTVVAGLVTAALLVPASAQVGLPMWEKQPSPIELTDVPAATPDADWVTEGHTCLYMTNDHNWQGRGANKCSTAGQCSNDLPDGRISSATPEEGVSCYLYTDTNCRGYSSAPLTFPGFADLGDINFDKKARSWRCHRLSPRDTGSAPRTSITPPAPSASGISKMMEDLIQAGVNEFEQMQQQASGDDKSKATSTASLGPRALDTAHSTHSSSTDAGDWIVNGLIVSALHLTQDMKAPAATALAERDDADIMANPREKYDKAMQSAEYLFASKTNHASTWFASVTSSASEYCSQKSASASSRTDKANSRASKAYAKATSRAVNKYGHFGPSATIKALSTHGLAHITSAPATNTYKLHVAPAWSHLTSVPHSAIDAIMPAITQTPNANGTAWVFDSMTYTYPVNEQNPSSFSYSTVTTVANTQPTILLPACRHMMRTNQTFQHLMGVVVSEQMAQEAQNKALNVSFPAEPETAPNDALLHACEHEAMSNVCFEALMQPSKMDQVIEAALLAFNQAADHSLDNAWNGDSDDAHPHHVEISEPTSSSIHALISHTRPAHTHTSSAGVHVLLPSIKPTITRHVLDSTASTLTMTRNGTVTEHIMAPSGTLKPHSVTGNGSRPAHVSEDVLGHCKRLIASDQTFRSELDRVNLARMEYAAWSALLGSDSQGLPELAHVAQMAYQEHKGELAMLLEPLYSTAMKASLVWECSDVMMHLNRNSGFSGVEERLYHLLVAFGFDDGSTARSPSLPTRSASAARTLGTVHPRDLPARATKVPTLDDWQSCRSKQDPKGGYIQTMIAMQNATVEGSAWLKVMQGELATNPTLNDTITRESLAAGSAVSRLEADMDKGGSDQDMSECLQEASAKYDAWAQANGKPSFEDAQNTAMELAAEKRAKEIERELLALLPQVKVTLEDNNSTANASKRHVTAREAVHSAKLLATCTGTFQQPHGQSMVTAEYPCSVPISVRPLATKAFRFPYPARGCGKKHCTCAKCQHGSSMVKRFEPMITAAPSWTLGKVTATGASSTKMCKSTYTEKDEDRHTHSYTIEMPCKHAPKTMDIVVPGTHSFGDFDPTSSSSIHALVSHSHSHSSVTRTITKIITPTQAVHGLEAVPMPGKSQSAEITASATLSPPYMDDDDEEDELIDAEIEADLEDCDLSTDSDGSGWWWPWSKPCSGKTAALAKVASSTSSNQPSRTLATVTIDDTKSKKCTTAVTVTAPHNSRVYTSISHIYCPEPTGGSTGGDSGPWIPGIGPVV